METGAAPVAPAPEPESETLEAGPGGGRHRLALPFVLAVAALVVAGLLAWQLWPRPVAPLTMTELQGVYAGMVRGDGTNDASVLPRTENSDPPSVSPAECLPLFETTAFDRFPAEATDGVGTYWMAERVGTSLFTFRFTDAAAATRAYAQVDAALTACSGRDVSVAEGRAPTVPIDRAQIERTPVTTNSEIQDQLGYLYAPTPSTRFAVHVLRFENLVNWQFRYDTAARDYSPLAAQQMMDSLVAQIRSVVDLRG